MADQPSVAGFEDESVEEVINARPLRAPEAPTAAEKEEHEANGHAQFRNWCRACLAGAGRQDQHRAVPDKEDHAFPALHIDYGFMGEKDDVEELDARCMPILCVKCDKDKWSHSHAVPHKGTKHPHGARKLADALLATGFPKVIVKSDQEPAILELKRAAAKLAREEGGITVVFEESHAYVSPTKGTAEQAIQAMERKVRTLK